MNFRLFCLVSTIFFVLAILDGVAGQRGGGGGTKIYVGNLSMWTTEDDLRVAFGTYGTVTDAVMIRDRQSGVSKGYGYVIFSDPEGASAAINDKIGVRVNGRTISVTLAY